MSGALDGVDVDFSGLGDADFSAVNDDNTRREAVKKGTAYMSVWMYVVREFEDAIDDCERACISCNYDSAHAWDEGVAFYTGSLEGEVGSSALGDGFGKMVYALAEKRCINFKTCGSLGDSVTGGSRVNRQLFQLFDIGQQLLQIPIIPIPASWHKQTECRRSRSSDEAEFIATTFRAALVRRLPAHGFLA